ncbi:MAG: CHAP domain-containing protein, partial [Actinomycetes bacterium]
MAAPAIAVTPTLACGQVLVPGSGWLSGSGVDVKYNLRVGGSSASCAGVSTVNPAVQNGGGWQCVELAARLYAVKGWGAIWAGGNGGAQYLPEGSPWLTFFANGSGYTPVPGDLVVETGGTYGHVSVVDAVVGQVIRTVEQNAAVSGRHDFPFVAGIATGSYSGVVRGFLHSPANGTAAHSAPAVKLPSASKLAAVRAGHRRAKVRW